MPTGFTRNPPLARTEYAPVAGFTLRTRPLRSAVRMSPVFTAAPTGAARHVAATSERNVRIAVPPGSGGLVNRKAIHHTPPLGVAQGTSHNESYVNMRMNQPSPA